MAYLLIENILIFKAIRYSHTLVIESLLDTFNKNNKNKCNKTAAYSACD